MPTHLQDREDLCVVGRYSAYRDAVEDGLAILAMGEAYWMFPEDGDYLLCVRNSARDLVEREIKEVSRLRQGRIGWRKRVRPLEIQRVRTFPFFVFGTILIGVFLLQWFGSLPIQAKGELDAVLMVQGGQWWRAATALTLHADLSHLVGNLAAGVGFGFWLSRYLGTSWAWTLIFLCGAAGNLLTALLYYPQPHLSIGASTAVFAALGLLTGFGWAYSREESSQRHSLPEWILPLLAGLTLLGMLGAGGPRTDILAHICGFGSGLLCSIAVSFLPLSLPQSSSRRWIGWVPIVGVVAAWILALS